MDPERTPQGKVVLYAVSTGQRHEAWPVDAEGLLGCGEYTAHPLDGTDATVATVGVTPQQPVAEPPATHPLGGPLVVTHAHEAAPSAPLELPTGRSKGWKKRAGG